MATAEIMPTSFPVLVILALLHKARRCFLRSRGIHGHMDHKLRPKLGRLHCCQVLNDKTWDQVLDSMILLNSKSWNGQVWGCILLLMTSGVLMKSLNVNDR